MFVGGPFAKRNSTLEQPAERLKAKTVMEKQVPQPEGEEEVAIPPMP